MQKKRVLICLLVLCLYTVSLGVLSVELLRKIEAKIVHMNVSEDFCVCVCCLGVF